MTAAIAPHGTVSTQDPNTLAFAFVQELAKELSHGKVDLPSIPDVAMQVRMVLADENATIDRVVRVTGSEPVLAATVLRMANSVAFNTSGKPVSDLRAAINRIGYNVVRTAAISFALAQLRRSAELKSIRHELEGLWEHGTHVAAISYVLAKRCTNRNPDEALLTGLLHNIGKLYILTRMVKHRELFSDSETLQSIMRDWHAHVGSAILENWQMPDEVCEAIRDHEDTMRTHRGSADLTDIVMASVVMSQVAMADGAMHPGLQQLKAFRSLGLDIEKSQLVISEMHEEIAALRQALSMG